MIAKNFVVQLAIYDVLNGDILFFFFFFCKIKWKYSRFQDSTLVSSQILMYQKLKRVFDLKRINKIKKRLDCV